MKVKALIAASVLAVAGVGIYLCAGSGSSLYEPSQAQTNQQAIADYQKLAPGISTNGDTAQCAYVPSKVAVGYQFTCYVYDSTSTEVAQLDYTVTTVTNNEMLYNVKGY